MHHHPFIAANRAGRHRQSTHSSETTREGVLEGAWVHFPGVWMPAGPGRGAGGRVNETAAGWSEINRRFQVPGGGDYK